jgi:hypothetical protein
MTVSAAERRFILGQLGQRAKDDMIRLWDAANRFDGVDFATYLESAFPDLVVSYRTIAAELSASYFELDFPDLDAVPAVEVSAEKYRESTKWALGADGRDALDRMSGTLQRAIFDGDRATTVANAQANGMRWIRVAKPTACAFCRMLATRTEGYSTYRSEDAALGVVGRSVNLSIGDRRAIASGQMTREEALARRDEMQLTYQIGAKKGSPRGRRPRGERKLGEKYHDFCECTAKAIPVGANPMDVLFQEDPEYATQVDAWNTEYLKSRGNAESGDPKKILSEWRSLDVDAR